MKSNNFIEKFQDKKIWLNWKKVVRDDKVTKVPYQPDGTYGKSTDESTWSYYEQVANSKSFDGVGVVFENKENLIGVDLDKCIQSNEIVNETIKKFVTEAKTYCEYSPSGTGLHLLFQATENIELVANKVKHEDGSAEEVYVKGRYFTFTANEHPLSTDIRQVTEKEFISLIELLGYPWKKDIHEEKIYEKSPYVSPFTNVKDIYKKMFSSKNGAEVEALYKGDTSKYNNDLSSADFALCQYLAFWTGKDYARIEQIWLESPLAQREKTQNRPDYVKRTIERAIETTSNVYTPPYNTNDGIKKDEYIMSAPKEDKKGNITKPPTPLPILENICRMIKFDDTLHTKFRLNDYSHMVETCWETEEWVNLYDNCIIELMKYMQRKHPYFRSVPKYVVTDAVMSVAYENKVNPPQDYFQSLVWDKKPRLNSWLSSAYGVPDDELNQAIGSNWIKGLVKRVMTPGHRFDEVLSLESPQGWRKSTSISELGKPWHVETTFGMDDKDFHLVVAKNMIVEFSEGDIFNRNSAEKIKSEITKPEDQFRAPYERGMATYKRSCVFAVTTNKLELKDETGNRRWLPVTLEKIADIDWIKQNRDQLYAEAYYRVMILGETTHEYPKVALEDLQQSRAEFGVTDESAVTWYAELPLKEWEEGVALDDACVNILGADNYRKGNKMQENMVCKILRRTLFLENKNKKIGGATLKRWVATEKTYKNIINTNSNGEIAKDF